MADRIESCVEPAPRPVSRWLRALGACAVAAYPLLVWRGLEAGSPRLTAIVLICLIAPMAWLDFRKRGRSAVRGMVSISIASLSVLAIAAALNRADAILAAPVTTNLVLLFVFGATLRAGSVPMIELFARLQEPDLDDEKRAWCRLWTKLWCAFFVFNASIATLLAVVAPLEWWAVYNGLIAYGLIGAMFAIEFVIRRRRFPAHRQA